MSASEKQAAAEIHPSASCRKVCEPQMNADKEAQRREQFVRDQPFYCEYLCSSAFICGSQTPKFLLGSVPCLSQRVEQSASREGAKKTGRQNPSRLRTFA